MSSLSMKDVLKTLLPKGAFWRPIPDGDYDQLFNGMGDNADEIKDYLEALAFLRDPQKTIILADLEREYGVLTDLRLDEQTRRDILSAYKTAKPGTGSDDDLENILREAGFDVYVYQNNGPTIDPDLLLEGYQTIAGTTNAVAGNAAAYAGRTGGTLIVNGAIFETVLTDPMQADGAFAYAGNQRAVSGYYLSFERERVEYDIPPDLSRNRWRYIFFIGGEVSGWVALKDWNMEQAGIANWRRADKTSVEKTFQAPHPLPDLDSRTLRINSEKNTDQQIFETAQPDPSLEMSALMFRNAGANVINIGWDRHFVDGDMERPGVSAWLPGNNAVLTKQTASPYKGKRYLRIGWGGGPPLYSASQTILRTTGRTYRIIGAARGDGVLGTPEIRQGGVVIWTGTTSTTWQPFDFTFTSAVDNFVHLRDGNTGSVGFVEFDDLAVYELVDLVDGDMEAAGVGSWSASVNATLTKEGGAYRGSQCLRVECASGSDPYAYQTILQSSQRYRMKGFIRSDGNATPNIRWGTTVVWIGTTSQDWQQFEIVFRNSGATEFRLTAATSTVGEYCEFDQITIEPLLPLEYSPAALTNVFSPRGLTGDLNGTSDRIDAGNIADFTDNFTLCAWIKTDDTTGGVILGRFDGVNNQYQWGVDVTGVQGFIDILGAAVGSATVNDGKWHFLAVVIDGSSSQFYFDGQPDGLTFTPAITSFSVNLEIGATGAGTLLFFDGEMNQPIVFSTAKSSAEIEALYELGKTVALNGSHVEQRLEDTITDPVPIEGIARGDGRISVPMIAIFDPVLGEWIPVWTGTQNYTEQAISTLAENGIAGIRLYSKFNEAASTWYDDIDITNPSIAFAQIPNEQREAFERLVLKYKPLHSWAGAVIEYI